MEPYLNLLADPALHLSSTDPDFPASPPPHIHTPAPLSDIHPMEAPSLFMSRLPTRLVADAKLRVGHPPLLLHWKHVRVSLRGHGALLIDTTQPARTQAPPLPPSSSSNTQILFLQVQAVKELRPSPPQPTTPTAASSSHNNNNNINTQRKKAAPFQIFGTGNFAQDSVVLDFAPEQRNLWLRTLQHAARTAPALDHYQVLQPIGKGGGGEVFLVRQRMQPTPSMSAVLLGNYNINKNNNNNIDDDDDDDTHSPSQTRPFGGPAPVAPAGPADPLIAAQSPTPAAPLLAMKVIQKYAAFHSETSLQHTLDERLVHQLLTDHPFIVSLRAAFQTDKAFYILTDFCSGGDLRTHLRRAPNSRLTEEEARPLFVQLILALEYIHSKNIIYRDLKPENVLLSETGDVRLTDFGLSKILTTGRWGRTKSFCGTPGYMSPDMVRRAAPYGIASDLWSLGALFYRVLVGRGPFETPHHRSSDPLGRKSEESETFRRIVQDDVEYPSFLSSAARELLEGLLEKEESKRRNLEEVKESLFFTGIDWDLVLEQARLGTRSWTRSDISIIDSEVSDESNNSFRFSAGKLSKFDVRRLNNMKLDNSELLVSTNTSDVSQNKTVRAASRAKRGMRRIASLRSVRPSLANSTHVVGFAYSSVCPAPSGLPPSV